MGELLAQLDVAHVRVDIPSAAATALGLTFTTWFTRAGVAIASAEQVERVVGFCPQPLFDRLKTLVGM